MSCIACKLPIDSFDIEDKYDCTYDEIAQAADNNCPRCSFAFQCIRTGVADVQTSDISKVLVRSNYYCELHFRNGCIGLETFTQDGQLVWNYQREITTSLLTLLPLYFPSSHIFLVVTIVLILNLAVEEGSHPSISRIRTFITEATNSETTIATIQSWIKECTTTHDACQHVHHPVVYPKRLLDLNGETVILRESIQPARYVCLSHCWGINTDVLKTITHNLNDFMTNIPWNRLTATFRDAITISRGLGIFYLWIDSLCIIQDSNDDWKDQASKMADIYDNAFITIAATKSKNSSGGCFAECDQKYLAKLVPGYQNIYVRQSPPLFPSHWVQLDKSPDWPLLNRAWIYQEMRLSRRILHFCANEVVWRCQTMQRSESGYNDDDFSDISRYRNMQHEHVPYSILQNNPRYLWYRTVQEYSRLKMTFESDKMPALAGLTKRMETMRPGDRFLAGLWEKTLLFDLLWMVWPRPIPGRRRNPQFPSWSWASVNCQVMWPDCVDSTLASVRVKKVRFVSIGPSHLGEFSEATITIQAPIIDANLLLSKRRSERPSRRPFFPWRRSPKGLSHNNIAMVEQLYLYDYKVDCLPSDLSAARSGPEPSGFVVPIGVSMINYVIIGVHVQLRPGSKCYERIGYVQISHPSMERALEAEHNRDYDQMHRDTVRVKELLESLPTSTIVLV